MPTCMPASRMVFRNVVLLVAITAFVAACSDMSVPQRGFAVQFFHRNIEPELDPKTVFEGPVMVAPDGRLVSVNSCEAAAKARAQDVAAQNFDLDLQQKVYESTLADCRKWHDRYLAH